MMRKNMFKIQHIFFAVLVAGAMVSCQKEDTPTVEPELTPEEQAEMAAADKFAAANSVYRALALINELPDNWESALYIPAEGVPVDEANSDIRNVVSTGAEHAKNYFLSIVPDLGLNGDTWSHEGIGTLTFRALNDDNCYAVIDVDLVQMPGLKQLRFVPEALVGENKWSGNPYYAVGDVVMDKNGIYWICVRPSGGPLAKDNAYFVSFDKSLIKTTEQKQDIYEVVGFGANAKKTKTKVDASCGKWVYAKNLVEERVAYAAAHVFACLADATHYEDTDVPSAKAFKEKADMLKEIFNPNLLCQGADKFFYIAYGSYQSSSKKVTQVKYLQPIMQFCLTEDPINYEECTLQNVVRYWCSLDDGDEASSNLYSLTDGHDPLTNAIFTSDDYLHGYKQFSILDYTIDYDPNGEDQFTFASGEYPKSHMPNAFNSAIGDKNIPLVMTQMSIKDHGKAASGYTLLHERLYDEPDYWASIENCQRISFEKGIEGKRTVIEE